MKFKYRLTGICEIRESCRNWETLPVPFCVLFFHDSVGGVRILGDERWERVPKSMPCGTQPGENSSVSILLLSLHYRTKASICEQCVERMGKKEAISTTSLRALRKFTAAGGGKVGRWVRCNTPTFSEIFWTHNCNLKARRKRIEKAITLKSRNT